ncbi:MAG: response regulator [Lachnospiraceae bacterium]|nr:response regulator [Lachnospiraceae bacterium]
MRGPIGRLKDRLFSAETDIHIKVFNVLALGGISVCFALFLYELIRGSDFGIVLAYVSGIVFSVAMLWYTLKTGKYKAAMITTIVAVFLGLFSYLFFSGGGYVGGAPCFFSFAIVFTAFLLEGRIAALLIAVEVCWYTAICIFAYKRPEYVTPLDGSRAVMIDVLTCALLSGIILAATMYLQNMVYRKKQLELAEAQREAELANGAKTDFLAKMSHDIRTPLNTMMAMNELIAQNTDSEEIKAWTDDSEVACNMLLSFFNDLVDISKIEAGKVDIHIVSYQLKSLLRKLNTVWALEAEKKGLKLELELDPSLPSVLSGGEYAINKILSNLISNAIKYSNKGTIRLAVSKCDTVQTENELKLCFSVEDQGVGIPAEFLDKIFVPFERGAQDYYDNREGSGLGLAIVKELAEKMSAEITCESEENRGSIFKLIITQQIVDEAPVGSVENWSEAVRENLTKDEDVIFPGTRLLVVDDNFYNRKVFRSLLEPLLIQVDDVESGAEALEMIEIRDYDLILMDLRMPDMSGEEALRAIREENPGFNVPVVVVTADAMLGTKEKMLQAGFDDFVTKPVNMDRLKGVLTAFVPDKMQHIDGEKHSAYTGEQILDFQKKLEKYGISVEDAFSINEGSAENLKMRADCFVETYAEISTALGKTDKNAEDGEKLYFTVHSLKSAAKGIGALTLSQLAAMIEMKKDDAFSELALPLLLKEYGNVFEGCRVLAELI